MRFLIGLIIGAGLTLLAATSFGVQPREIIDHARDLWRRVNQQPAVIASQGSTIEAHQKQDEGTFDNPLSDAPDGGDQVATHALRANTPTASGPTPEPEFAARTADPTSEPSPNGSALADASAITIGSSNYSNDPTSAPGRVDTAAAVPRDPQVVGDAFRMRGSFEPDADGRASTRLLPPLQPEPALPATPTDSGTFYPGGAQTTAAPHPAVLADEVTTGHTKPRTEAAWTPFHSERSALGFANRLERHLGRGFEVSRQGPARYAVVFAYANDQDRNDVLTQIETITGYRNP